MKIALVTGASSGMGRDFVRALDSYGFDEIWAIARREKELCSLADECATKVRTIPLDLRQEESFGVLKKLLSENSPEIAYLVCAAGYGRFGEGAQVGNEDSEGMINLNCTALVKTTYMALPHMKKGGRIIEIASASAFQPLPYMNVYAATKAFVLSFSRALGNELRRRGITVTALCPGWVKTQFIHNAEKTDRSTVNSFPGISESDRIVKKALSSANKGKAICVPGALYKTQRVLSRMLPTSALMAAWNMIRK